VTPIVGGDGHTAGRGKGVTFLRHGSGKRELVSQGREREALSSGREGGEGLLLLIAELGGRPVLPFFSQAESF